MHSVGVSDCFIKGIERIKNSAVTCLVSALVSPAGQVAK